MYSIKCAVLTGIITGFTNAQARVTTIDTVKLSPPNLTNEQGSVFKREISVKPIYLAGKPNSSKKPLPEPLGMVTLLPGKSQDG